MRRSGKLTVRRVPVARLTRDDIDAMWRLYDDHYDNVQRPTFERDLAEKQYVFLGRDRASGEIVGFSTALFYRQAHAGRTIGVYFSGDTIIHPRYWGQRGLHNAVFTSLLRWKLRHPATPLYWYLICSGYRTYMTLVRNFPNHWPHHGRPTPAWEASLIDAVSGARYGEAWKPDRGVIAFPGPQPVVRQVTAPFTADVLALPEVQFFIRANPGHLDGDELAMLARLDLDAITAIARRALRLRPSPQRASRGTPQPSPVLR
jgi:hypothetical protein